MLADSIRSPVPHTAVDGRGSRDLSQLKSLGEIAGIGGLAIGVVLLLVRPLIDKLGIVPAAQRGPLVRLIAGGAFGIGVLGIGAWRIAGTSGPAANTAGNQSPAIIGGGNVSVGAPAPQWEGGPSACETQDFCTMNLAERRLPWSKFP